MLDKLAFATCISILFWLNVKLVGMLSRLLSALVQEVWGSNLWPVKSNTGSQQLTTAATFVFIGRSCVAWCNVVETCSTNLLHASAYYSEHIIMKIDLIFCYSIYNKYHSQIIYFAIGHVTNKLLLQKMVQDKQTIANFKICFPLIYLYFLFLGKCFLFIADNFIVKIIPVK